MKYLLIVIVITFSTTIPLRASGPEYNADINRDGIVNVLDQSLLARNWGRVEPELSESDINGDGKVDIFDLSIMASQWGRGSIIEPIEPETPVVPAIPVIEKAI